MFLLSCFNLSYAEENNNTITINSVYNDENGVIASGSISSGKAEEITILVLDENEEISYIDQKKSNSDGSFEFRFKMKNPEQYGQYTVRIGGENVNTPKEVIFDYTEYIPMVEKEILNNDINVSISAYKPTITGSLECFEGRELEMVILNTTDNTEIANEVILSNNGVFNFTYELPNLIYPKNYKILIECKNGEESLMALDVEISSSTITVSASGNITLAENVRMAGIMQSANTDLLNKEFNFTNSKSVSLTIPNLVASMACNMSFKCFETVPEISDEETIEETKHIVSGSAGSEILLNIFGNNIISLSNKEVTIKYNPQELEVTDLCQFTSLTDTSTGIINDTNIEILSLSEGEITFKINKEILENKVFCGLLNAISFRKINNENSEISYYYK